MPGVVHEQPHSEPMALFRVELHAKYVAMGNCTTNVATETNHRGDN
jgi:hypothetical protein